MYRLVTLKTLLKVMWLWPPFLGAGIRVIEVSDDITSVKVQMKLKSMNKNYVGTHFGGSLYSMTDPFYMLMLIHNLGKDYVVWDKGASINFKKPARGKVVATFCLTKEKIEEIKSLADNNPKVEPKFMVHILNTSGEVVAEVEKLLYVKRKDKIKDQVSV